MTRTKINDYKYFQEITTRWNDNDVRWHVNNAKYYEFFDTIINKYLIDLKSFDLKTDKNFLLPLRQVVNILKKYHFLIVLLLD